MDGGGADVQNMLFLVLYLLAMSLPGAGISYMFKLDTCGAALSIALSLSVAVLVLVLARAAGLGTTGYGYGLICAYLLIAVGVLVARRRQAGASFFIRPLERIHIVPVLTLGTMAVYTLWAGPYTEVPADAWWHIGRINDRLSDAAAGGLGKLNGVGDVFDKSSGYWYTIAAFFLHLSRSELENALPNLALANTLLFCAGIYAFSLFVFRDIVDNRWTRHWVAAATVIFFAAHFGLSVFSYLRYYVYAPTFLSYILYLAAVACVLRVVEAGETTWRFLIAAVIMGLAAAMVHTQEAVFVVAMSGAVVLVEFIRLHYTQTGASGQDTASPDRAYWRVMVLLAVCILAYASMHIWAFIALVRHNPLTHGVMADIRNYLPFLQNLYILKPTHQFYQVVTVWGLLVYVVFLARIRIFSRSPYLVAGMAMPVLTVFNPVFTDLFLRFSWPEVLWRMSYMLPLPFVGGYFLVKGVQGSFPGRRLLTRAASLGMAAALVVLLLPIRTTYFVSPHSKIYTLASVEAASDHRLWSDLLGFLQTGAAGEIVTDPVTGYVINGLTSHRYPGYKFYGSRAFRVDKDAYRARDFESRNGWLIVINERDGAPSAVGRFGGHWPEDVMRVSRHYSQAFRDFVTGRPEMFKELWTRDRISVYRVLQPK